MLEGEAVREVILEFWLLGGGLLEIFWIARKQQVDTSQGNKKMGFYKAEKGAERGWKDANYNLQIFLREGAWFFLSSQR